MMSNFKVTSIVNEIQSYFMNLDNGIIVDKEVIINSISKKFPSLSHEELSDLIDSYVELHKNTTKEKIDLAVTIPHSFSIKANPTSVVMENLLKSAERTILITGYSISDYFEDLLDIIIGKINTGIVVRLYVNDFEKKKDTLDKLLMYKGKYLEIYNYNNDTEGINALHAKIISVDNEKTLITSANLSFNGLQKNIEVGSIIESERIANNLNDMFYQLFRKKVFVKVM